MNKNWSIAIAGVLALSSLAGCASSSAGPNQSGTHAQNTANQKPAHMRNSLAHSPNAYTQSTNANHYRNGYTVNGFDQNMAERLTKVADDVPGVDRATVVVSGKDAVIGVRIRDNLAPEQQKVIEQKVHSAARAVSPTMNIRVTAEPAMFTRIRVINDSIYNEAQQRTHNVSQVPHSMAHNMSNTANDFGILLKDLGRTVTAPFR
ncbi:YhcN/YlaJ family sporulation lipoprotein [Brevibacillus choshinensis]|uniref:YhcN/YlaJ family sporulation lipoprotein n=1 Tax=Brevibacillus choshinensis TaxID=54911 RepID=A0ABX7FHW8_BRECH|nr:YhcN/YlaJ family sporulation lipoprotein [Brevibacillus choshinensis]QRG65808.1 YhcN/YlaJ family sporulation lipoprotein [Brevibacillus choshinensis]